MNADTIYTFADPRASLGTVGGKGASLAKLAAAGLPVPGGFHVTTAAYAHFVTHNQLGIRITEHLSAVDVDQPETLTGASEAIQQLFESGVVPEETAAEILKAYDRLGDAPAVAVRSSERALQRSIHGTP